MTLREGMTELELSIALETVARNAGHLGLIRLRAFGVFSLKVSNPQLFIAEVAGTQSIYTTDHIENFLRDLLVGRLNDFLGETLKTIFELPQYFDEMAAGLKGRIADDFAKYGLEISDFVINSITPPEEVQQMIDERSGMGAVGLVTDGSAGIIGMPEPGCL